VVDYNTLLVIDKAENNPTTLIGTGPLDDGIEHAAWMVALNLKTGAKQTLNAQTNSFCAGGAFLSNGSMVSVGGNARLNPESYFDTDGLTSVRIFPKCGDTGCQLFEDLNTHRLASARWYPGTIRLQDGSIMIAGGSECERSLVGRH
jgi:hypothetical protein